MNAKWCAYFCEDYCVLTYWSVNLWKLPHINLRGTMGWFYVYDAFLPQDSVIPQKLDVILSDARRIVHRRALVPSESFLHVWVCILIAQRRKYSNNVTVVLPSSGYLVVPQESPVCHTYGFRILRLNLLLSLQYCDIWDQQACHPCASLFAFTIWCINLAETDVPSQWVEGSVEIRFVH